MNIEFNYDLISLSNGLPVALRRLDTPDVSISFSVNAGSIHETEGQYGLTHLVEHLFFRSLDGVNFKENLLQITGRDIPHATTDPEQIKFHFRMPREDVKPFLELWGRAVANTTYQSSGFETERNVVLQEITPMQTTGTMWEYITHLRKMYIFPNCVLGLSPGGEIQDVKRASPDTVAEFKKERVHANSISIAVVGGFEEAAITDILEKYFGKLPQLEKLPLLLEDIPGCKPFEEQKVFAGMSENVLYLNIQVPGMHDKDFLTTAILREYLGGGMSSPLSQVLREKHGLVYSTGIGYDGKITLANRNVWSINASRFDMKNYDLIKRLIMEEINKVQQGDIDNNLLQLLRHSATKEFYEIHIENQSEQAAFLARYVSGRIPYTLQEKLDRWRTVTPKDLAHVAQKIFNGKYVTVTFSPN